VTNAVTGKPTILPNGTAAVRRNLDWPGCLNARDLGGLPTKGEGRVRDGALIADTMLLTLAYLRDQYGGVAPYLRRGGVNGLQLDALCERFVGF
jgi:hypothetical protein